jgi:UDP-N-acetyl-D-mannosaminuronic acid dehydrogenase
MADDMDARPFDVAVIGGAGHVGLPFALILAECGFKTCIVDVNREAVDGILAGRVPFREEGAEPLLESALEAGTLDARLEPSVIAECRFVVMIIGTPIDAHLNPSFGGILKVIEDCRRYFHDGQTLVLRSTCYPGTSKRLQSVMKDWGLDVRVAFCPERVAEGKSITEFRTLPQVISAFDGETLGRVRELFGGFAPSFVELEPMEAELCKLMTNAWRYVQFATTNQFYMIATGLGLDYERILHACRHDYPRMIGMPGPGYAAGPCLRKDTMQLAAVSRNEFVLGHAAMLVNEGLPAFVIDQAKARIDLGSCTLGILGMAFKAESDDIRDSLSYKLKKLLQLETSRVLTTDPYVADDPALVPLERVLEECDVVFVGVPHPEYRGLKLPERIQVFDVWGCLADSGPDAS